MRELIQLNDVFDDEQQAQLRTEQLWRRWKLDGDIKAKNELIESYLPLVQFVASRMSVGLPKNVTSEDLMSCGTLGLIDAVDKFDLDRGLRFETYASWRIRGAIIDSLRQNDWVPRSVREKAKKIEEAYQVLEQKYMRSVTDDEVSEYLQVSKAEFRKMLQDVAITTVFSLEEPIKEDETESRQTLILDERAKNPAETVDELYRKEALAQAIERLTEKERTVVSLFYYEELTLGEIAHVMSLTPSRISQLHSKAILKLRGSLAQSQGHLMNH